MPLTNVQAWSTANSGTGTGSVSVSWGSARTSGNLLVLVYTCDAVFTVPSGWTSAVRALDYSDMRIMYRIADNTSTDAPTITPSAASCMAWAEYSGNTATPLDQTASGTNNTVTGATTRATGTTAATSQADELAVAAWYWSGPTGYTGGAHWSGQTNSYAEQTDDGTSKGSGANVGLCVATVDLAAAAATSSTASITLIGTASQNGLGGAVATFKAAAAGGATRGMPFGPRGTAFNGGRTFKGPMFLRPEPVHLSRKGRRAWRDYRDISAGAKA